ncbi:hypothetical protein H4S08_004029 [Coemansia sp. RSA 1365]|nr:hypothetical protein H4S08_004029 [Coemansia sp. RSA 1365]
MRLDAENRAESNAVPAVHLQHISKVTRATILLNFQHAAMTSTGTTNVSWPTAGQTHQDTVAAGLQRQLDELRELIRLSLSGDGNGSSSDDPQDKSALETMQRLQSENEQQRVRIIHLLRALDSQDRLIDQLCTELGRN